MTVSVASFQGQEFKGSKISAVDGVIMYKGYSVVFYNTEQLLLCRRCRGKEHCLARYRGQINMLQITASLLWELTPLPTVVTSRLSWENLKSFSTCPKNRLVGSHTAASVNSIIFTGKARLSFST